MKKSIFVLLLIFILFFLLAFIKKLDEIPVRQTKDYNTIIVNNEKILSDYNVFINVPTEYSAIE